MIAATSLRFSDACLDDATGTAFRAVLQACLRVCNSSAAAFLALTSFKSPLRLTLALQIAVLLLSHALPSVSIVAFLRFSVQRAPSSVAWPDMSAHLAQSSLAIVAVTNPGNSAGHLCPCRAPSVADSSRSASSEVSIRCCADFPPGPKYVLLVLLWRFSSSACQLASSLTA